MKVQEYLRNNSIDKLKTELGINSVFHPTLPLVILNYDMIDSPKTNPIVRECRGLVLETITYNLIAKPFNRFFNYGEVEKECKLFNFNDFMTHEKVDGSLILLYHYNNNWMLNTRGSFAQDIIEKNNPRTWTEGIYEAMSTNSGLEITQDKLNNSFLDPKLTYVCEFCSPYNHVVRKYKKPILYLLTVFEGENELSYKETKNIAKNISIFKELQSFKFNSIDQITSFLTEQSSNDPTFEGVVIRDNKNQRWKIKNKTFLSLHEMKCNKDDLFNSKYLLPWVLAGDGDELLTYYPEVKNAFFNLKDRVDSDYAKLKNTWEQNKDIKDQKEFAVNIQGKTPYTSILFNLRKNDKNNLREIWQNSHDMILKKL